MEIVAIPSLYLSEIQSALIVFVIAVESEDRTKNNLSLILKPSPTT